MLENINNAKFCELNTEGKLTESIFALETYILLFENKFVSRNGIEGNCTDSIEQVEDLKKWVNKEFTILSK